jgi:galactofuranosylgalactofuranosylrhamnosyl-N-acetylglucosaminyl-diphospho-decaprenol beta-1,5/1,6-galactofuranosyltransferase
MSERVLQRCVFPMERRLHALYYRIDRQDAGRNFELESHDRLSIRFGRGCKLITDTYFNSFFESYWRRHTRLDGVRLRVLLSGRGTVLLVRRSPATGLSVIDAVDFDGERAEVVFEIPRPRLHHREAGALHFDIIAGPSAVRLHRAHWSAVDLEPEPMSMVAGYCTFNREPFLLRNIESLLEDPEVAGSLSRIVVVDQGTSRLRDHPDFGRVAEAAGAKLLVIEQDNFGGAGGFTRSILESRAMPGATHMLLMDDDAVTEPESVFRAAAFQSLAAGEVGLGGQMLDMLRPMEVYESGALVDPPTLGVKTPIHRLHAEASVALNPFLEVSYVHYNAWWFFAFPLRLVDRVGLPLPIFIRGDDVEFGYRLHRAGVTTTVLPGLGIWHEPFYLKRGGWQAYYDLRNMLILTSLHFPMSRRQVARIFLKRLLMQLLSLNYYEAAILCEAVDDFCRGPEIADAHPREFHRKLVEMKRGMTEQPVPRSECLPTVTPAPPPATPKRIRKHMIRCLIRQITRPGPPPGARPGRVIPDDYARWWCLAMEDVVAAEDWHTEDHRVYRRSRESFLKILKHGLRSALRLYRNHARLAAEWRASAQRLSGLEFWERYLGIEPTRVADDTAEGRTHRAA